MVAHFAYAMKSMTVSVSVLAYLTTKYMMSSSVEYTVTESSQNSEICISVCTPPRLPNFVRLLGDA